MAAARAISRRGANLAYCRLGAVPSAAAPLSPLLLPADPQRLGDHIQRPVDAEIDAGPRDGGGKGHQQGAGPDAVPELLAGMCGCLGAALIWHTVGSALYRQLQRLYRLCFAKIALRRQGVSGILPVACGLVTRSPPRRSAFSRDERISQLIQALKRSDKLHLKEAASLLGVSEMTR
jgi:hypothetical protein